MLATVAKVGSPLAIGTALLFYFGWIRAEAQARALGYDVTLLGLTTSDYVLRSINVLFLPLVTLLLLALAVNLLHPRLVRALERGPGRASRVLLLGSLRHAWLWCSLGGIIAFALLPASRAAVLPFSLTLGIVLSLYGDALHRRLYRRPKPSLALTTLVLVLLGVLVFWDVERIAGYMGTQFAEYITATPERYAKVTLYSAKSLQLPALVTETPVGSEQSAYRFRYDGLRLLLRSDGKYFLLAYGPRGTRPTVILLPESDDVRAEFTR